MGVTVKNLALNDQIAGTSSAAVDTLYSAPAGAVGVIEQATAYNAYGSAVVLTLYILASGVAATSVDPVEVVTINAGEAAILTRLIGHRVPKGGSLAAFAGTTAVVRVSVSGSEVS